MDNSSSSIWKSKFKGKKIRLAFCIYNNDYNVCSIAISSISAYVKKVHPDVEVRLFHIIAWSQDEKYNPEGFVNFVKSWSPDVFAISILSTHWEGVKPYLTELKKELPATAILAGGYQPILQSEQTINFDPIDFICDGDGEYPCAHLISYLKGEISGPVKGLWEKLNDGSIQKSEKILVRDLSVLPFPDYEIYEVNGDIVINNLTEQRVKVKLLPVMTSRGCVYHCTYCSNSTLLKAFPDKKNFIRHYEIDAMIEELVRLRDRYEIQYFEFWDELFFADMKYVNEFIPKYKDKVKKPFSVVSRIEVMDFDLCKRIAEAGCDAIYFGLESGSEDYRRKYLKRFDKNERIIEAAENCRLNGIKRITFNIIGLPFETKSQMIETLELNKLIDPEYFFIFIYIPLRGTALYELAEKEGMLYDQLRSVHYLDGRDLGKVRMNIKQKYEGASEQELNEVYAEMLKFQNRQIKLYHNN
jgi:anaerobic magnesium-protoporphyrin IX monomethyl ester cyclase